MTPLPANDDFPAPAIGARTLLNWLIYGVISYALLSVVGVTVWQIGRALGSYLGWW